MFRVSFDFFKSISVCEFVYFEIFVCLILLCEIANVGADLPGAVGVNVPIGKGWMGACTQRKNCQKQLEKMHTLWSIDSQENK